MVMSERWWPSSPDIASGCGGWCALRLDRRLQGRLDPSDVLQDAYLDVARRTGQYVAKPSVPVFLWLRLITGQRLAALHRQHLGAQMRDAGQEVSLYRGALPYATSASLAALLLGRLTSPTQAAQRAEVQIRLLVNNDGKRGTIFLDPNFPEFDELGDLVGDILATQLGGNTGRCPRWSWNASSSS